MNDLPNDMIIELLVTSPFDDMISLCRSNKRISKLCRDNRYQIYSQRYKREFPHVPIAGNIVEHYDKLMRGNGTKYYILDLDNKISPISRNPDPDHPYGNKFFIVPGNTFPKGTVVYISNIYHNLDDKNNTCPNIISDHSYSVSFTLNDAKKSLRNKILDIVKAFNKCQMEISPLRFTINDYEENVIPRLFTPEERVKYIIERGIDELTGERDISNLLNIRFTILTQGKKGTFKSLDMKYTIILTLDKIELI